MEVPAHHLMDQTYMVSVGARMHKVIEQSEHMPVPRMSRIGACDTLEDGQFVDLLFAAIAARSYDFQSHVAVEAAEWFSELDK